MLPSMYAVAPKWFWNGPVDFHSSRCLPIYLQYKVAPQTFIYVYRQNVSVLKTP